jgi:cytochrome P450
MYFAIDLINIIAFGEAMGDLDTDSDRFDYIKDTETGMRLMVDLSALGLLPIIQIPWIARLVGPSEIDGVGFGRVLRHVRTRIEARLEQGTDKRFDMLASFVRHGLTQDELLTEALLQIVAGSDTTATAIRSILLYVFTHPPVYARLQSEIDSTVAAGRAPPVPGIIADLDAKGLPYLQAVIREGMRIHTPAAGPFAKRVPDGGDTVVVDGKSVFLPGGTNINSAAYAVLLDKGVYGEDADEFRPERWLLEKDEAKLVLMHRTSDLTFGYGRYQCLGKPIALMEISKTVFEAS